MLTGLLIGIGCGDDDDDDDNDDPTDDDDDDNDDNDDDNNDDDNDNDDNDDSAADYTTTHDPAWDCYLCHGAENWNGAPPQPHGDQLTAPVDCLICHDEGDLAGSRHGPWGHNESYNCLECHLDEHDRDWENRFQCVACHWLP